MDAVLEVAPLLVPDQDDGAPSEAADAGHDRRIVGPAAVAVQLDPVLDQALDVVERVRPVLVACELDLLPDLVPGRLGGDALELFLEPRELAREPGAAQQAHAAQLAQPVADTQLGFTGHCRRPGETWRRKP